MKEKKHITKTTILCQKKTQSRQHIQDIGSKASVNEPNTSQKEVSSGFVSGIFLF